MNIEKYLPISDKEAIQQAVNEINIELERLYDPSWMKDANPCDVDLDNSHKFIHFLSPISVLANDQQYSSEQFILDCLELFGYEGKFDESIKLKRKKYLLTQLNTTVELIRNDDKPCFSDEYKEYLDQSKIVNLHFGYEFALFDIQKLIKSMFLLKAHFIKYNSIMFRYLTDDDAVVNELSHFITDYKLFLEYKLKDLNKSLKIMQELDIMAVNNDVPSNAD